MASLTDTLTGLKNKPEASGSTQQRYPVQYINYACLEASAYNFYPMSEIEDLADAIELAGGILQPLLVRRKAPGHYEIIAGHRRWTATKYLVEQGRTQYAMLPCHVQDGDELVAKINLIVTNSQREKTPYVKMQEITELEQLLHELASGSEEEKAMEAGKIGISLANELAGMKPEEQQMVAKQIDAGEKITLQPKKKTVKTTEKQDAVESRSVSESDTTQCKQSESRKIVRTEQHEEEQLPGQISVDDYVSEGFELRDTNEEIDVAVSVDDVAKKESSTTTENDLMQSLAHDYLALYERGDGSETEWQAMHRQLAEYFANLIR